MKFPSGCASAGAAVVTVGGSSGDVHDEGWDGDGEGAGSLLTAYGIGLEGAVLVRQDGFVALRRADAPTSAAGARALLAKALDDPDADDGRASVAELGPTC